MMRKKYDSCPHCGSTDIVNWRDSGLCHSCGRDWFYKQSRKESRYVVRFHVDYDSDYPITVTASDVETAKYRAAQILYKSDDDKVPYGIWYGFEPNVRHWFEIEKESQGLRSFDKFVKDKHLVKVRNLSYDDIFYMVDSVEKDGKPIVNYSPKGKSVKKKVASRAKATKPLPYLTDMASNSIRKSLDKLGNSVYSTIDVTRRGDKFDAMIVLNVGTDNIPWKWDEYDRIFSKYAEEWDIKNREAVMLYGIYPKYLVKVNYG